MSRKILFSMQSSANTSSGSTNSFCNKETNTDESLTIWTQNSFLKRYFDFKFPPILNTYFLKRFKSLILKIFILIITSLRNLLKFQIAWLVKIHALTYNVMLLDAWILRRFFVGDKLPKFLALCLIPLLILGGKFWSIYIRFNIQGVPWLDNHTLRAYSLDDFKSKVPFVLNFCPNLKH